MLISVAKGMINAFPIHVTIVVIVLICGKHLVVLVKDRILEKLVNTVRFNTFFIVLTRIKIQILLLCPVDIIL